MDKQPMPLPRYYAENNGDSAGNGYLRVEFRISIWYCTGFHHLQGIKAPLLHSKGLSCKRLAHLYVGIAIGCYAKRFQDRREARPR